MAQMVANISTPSTSKINWTNIISAVVAIAAAFGFIIPQEYQLIAAQILSIMTPIITVFLRTWFTNK